ncbi:hypothetical protein GCM10009665_79200 [Kitasatospora nipponensis]|uniref:Uncharacterized protein n=1 Tax=Kitasatospora nipponensis TaxID=258049 RepID=A0ABN1TBF3_9ACTN
MVDADTVVEGLVGSVFGLVMLCQGAESVELGGVDPERWITERGGEVRVLQPRRTRPRG